MTLLHNTQKDQVNAQGIDMALGSLTYEGESIKGEKQTEIRNIVQPILQEYLARFVGGNLLTSADQPCRPESTDGRPFGDDQATLL